MRGCLEDEVPIVLMPSFPPAFMVEEDEEDWLVLV